MLAALVLVVAGLGTWASLGGSGSHAKGATTMPSMSAKAKQKPAASALMTALVLANKSGDATGKLPASSCKQDNPTHVTCTGPAAGVSGVVGWNHVFQHTRKYTVNQMIMGMVQDDQAAGRVFCNYTQGLEYMVWTQNDGHLMGYVAGPVHTDIWDWWVAVHHNIGIGGAPMNM